MLLAAGVILAFLGLDYLGMDGGIVAGLRAFWTHLNLAERLPFAGFNRPPDFNFVGIFWQDGFASSITFLFINQGLIMRFLAAKSVNEGRKTILFNTLFLLPISAIVVGNAGWIGNAMEAMGILGSDTDPKSVFIEVAKLVCAPGVFGFVLAALTAALMSTIDTLTNAVAALFVYDVYQPYLAKRRSDRHYLSVARIVSLASSGVAFAVGVSFSYYPDMYQAHANFIALITPPIVVAVFLGAFWKGYTPSAAFWSMFGGAVLTWSSKKFPFLVAPFATWLHGVEPGPDGTYTYMTAFFGIAATAVLGVTISMFTRPKPESEIVGLWIGSIELGKRRFKGGKPNYQVGRKICAALRVSEVAPVPVDAPAADSAHLINQEPHVYPCVRLSGEDMSAMKAEPGDLLYVADARRWLGGLRSLHCRAALPHDEGRVVLITAEAFEAASFLAGREVRVEKTL
jgi:SSS family solute:Na+ symporter